MAIYRPTENNADNSKKNKQSCVTVVQKKETFTIEEVEAMLDAAKERMNESGKQ